MRLRSTPLWASCFAPVVPGGQTARTTARRRHRGQGAGHQYGAAALEYVLVSTFAAVVTVAALVFIGGAVREQLSRLGEKLGVAEAPTFDLPFGNN